MTVKKFSEYVMDIHELYNLADKNGFYLPQQSSSAVNELFLFNVLTEKLWCPMYHEIKLEPCPKPP